MNKKVKIIIIVVVIAIITAIAIGVGVSATSKEKQEATTATSSTTKTAEAYAEIKSELNSISFEANDKDSLNKAKEKYLSLLNKIESDQNKESAEAQVLISSITDKIKDIDNKIKLVEEKENSTTTKKPETTTKKAETTTKKKVETTTKKVTTTKKPETTTKKPASKDPADRTVVWEKPSSEEWGDNWKWRGAGKSYVWNASTEMWEMVFQSYASYATDAEAKELIKYRNENCHEPNRPGKYDGEEVTYCFWMWFAEADPNA